MKAPVRSSRRELPPTPGRGAARSLLLLCLVPACGRGDVRLDAGSDSGAPDARVESPDASPNVCPALSGFATPHRTIPPFPPPATEGGLVSSLTLISITTSGDPLAARLHAFGDALIGSQWFKTVGAAYGLAPPVASLHVVDAPVIAASLSPSGVAKYLSDVVTRMGPQPDGNLLYILYCPDSNSLGGTAGFHDSFSRYAIPRKGQFAAIARPTFDMYPETDFDMMTVDASHEIMEAATNLDRHGLQYDQAGTPWSRSAWASLQDGVVEVADVCAATRTFEQSGGGGFYYQRIFDNAIALQCGDDPCIPPEPGPYYNVTVPQYWYPAAPGQTVAIPLSGWSTAPMNDWMVAAARINGFPQGCGGSECPVLSIATARGTGTAPGCSPHQAINNGVSGTLSVQMPADAMSGDFSVIVILSFRENAGPMGCDRAADTDYYHQWPVGVYVP